VDVGGSGCRMTRGCYEETACVEFKLNVTVVIDMTRYLRRSKPITVWYGFFARYPARHGMVRHRAAPHGIASGAAHRTPPYVAMPCHSGPVMERLLSGGVAGRGVDTADVRRTAYRRRHAVQRQSSRCARVEPAGARRDARRPGPIQVHRQHATCPVQGRHASRQRSAIGRVSYIRIYLCYFCFR